MPEPVEKRSFPRTQVRLPFLFTPNTSKPIEPGTGWTYNLGEEGACVKLPNRLDEGSGLQLVFQTDRGPLEIAATVIWRSMIRQRGQEILHGVEFPALNPAQQQALRKLLCSEGQGEESGTP
jgi:hypothetical protein